MLQDSILVGENSMLLHNCRYLSKVFSTPKTFEIKLMRLSITYGHCMQYYIYADL